MAKNSAIEWTDHTCNFWWGCEWISEACDNCYAKAFAKRVGRDCFGGSPRYKTKGPWKDVLKWDRDAGKRGVRERVFINSMSDIGESNEQIGGWRDEALQLLSELKNLDVLLLTKRPEHLGYVLAGLFDHTPNHFWLGVTAENQYWYEKRTRALLSIPHDKYFLSMEPMISMIDMEQALVNGFDIFELSESGNFQLWVIAGAESGPRMRVAQQSWFRILRNQCRDYHVPFMLKQMHVDEGKGLNTKIKLVKAPYLDGEQELDTPFEV